MNYAGLKALIPLLAVAVAVTTSVNAAWPDKPLQLIVPYTPGGFTDSIR